VAHSTLHIDKTRRQLTCNGRKTVLQEKAWQVFALLRRQAPAIVDRREIIDSVWRGNWLTGEKGLNQSIWTLRQALGDDARAPRFIRTIPRRGYQWIYVASAQKAVDLPWTSYRVTAPLAVGLAIAAGGLGLLSMSAPGSHDMRGFTEGGRALRAYLVDRDVHVELESGCVGVLKNGNNAALGEPVVSADGREIAVAVHAPEGCRLVTIDVASGEKKDFGRCPGPAGLTDT